MSAGTFLQRMDELIDLHLRAMDYGPASFAQRRILWTANSSRPGFTAAVALEHATATPATPTDRGQRICGIAYGFPGQPTSWWYREVHRGLCTVGYSPADASAVLSDFDEISEVHVLPGFQGHGIGARMMADLLPRLGSSTAMLSTPEVPDEANAAWGLYRSFGFRDLLRHFRFASDPRPFGILARPSDPASGPGRLL